MAPRRMKGSASQSDVSVLRALGLVDQSSSPIAPGRALVSKIPIISYRQKIRWENGIPIPISVPIRISKDPETALITLLKGVLDLPYDGEDPTLQGVSQGEAIVINMVRGAANGNAADRNDIFDRILGKPLQNIHSTEIKGDLNILLDQIAADHLPDSPQARAKNTSSNPPSAFQDVPFETVSTHPANTPDDSAEDL